MKFYTGIGSRETPTVIMDLMTAAAVKLTADGFILRSGGADGADSAFEEGAESKSEIYLPWEGFNGRECARGFNKHFIVAPRLRNYAEACKIASETHPAWDRCSRGARALHARNVYQVLGRELDDPSGFLICYAKPTATGVLGGTNTAYQIALKNDVEVVNLWHPEQVERLEEWLNDS